MPSCEHPTYGGPDDDRGHIAVQIRADIPRCAITKIDGLDGPSILITGSVKATPKTSCYASLKSSKVDG
jgi:hypothetical protein